MKQEAGDYKKKFSDFYSLEVDACDYFKALKKKQKTKDENKNQQLLDDENFPTVKYSFMVEQWFKHYDKGGD